MGYLSKQLYQLQKHADLQRSNRKGSKVKQLIDYDIHIPSDAECSSFCVSLPKPLSRPIWLAFYRGLKLLRPLRIKTSLKEISYLLSFTTDSDGIYHRNGFILKSARFYTGHFYYCQYPYFNGMIYPLKFIRKEAKICIKL